MKALENFFKKDQQVYAFVIIGIILIIFPDVLTALAPYIIGITLVVYSIINVFTGIRNPDSEVRLGDAIIKGILGLIILFQEEKSISVIGIIWAMESFYEVAEEIDNYRKRQRFHIISLLSMIISIILAATLIMDPFEHFTVHVIVLGIEMIVTVFIRSRDKKQDLSGGVDQ
ncbi:MAG: DUF308 domain-containing protein [Lachnospiraceae bacterium]|nr:DUF308 domain-containing protein [Lachnospiraceae bacterium]